MSISIYYEFSKPSITSRELDAIKTILAKYSKAAEIRDYISSGQGFNGEDLTFERSETDNGVLFWGASKLPNNSLEDMWFAVQHWCSALSEIRNVVGGNWDVSIDDKSIFWNGKSYDPVI